MKNKKRSNILGVISAALTLAFWAYADSGVGPNAFTRSPYVLYVLLPRILATSALLAVAAANWGSRWWLLALIGPAIGTILLLSAGA
jgi:hypothetical protein